MNPLHALAAAAGLQVEWWTAGGERRQVGDDSLRAILAALGYPATTERQAVDSMRAAAAEAPAPPVGDTRCATVAEVTGRERVWGVAAQVYALRDERDTAYGDFGTLASAAAAFGRSGADALAISPTHALFPADASRYSPYAPSSRLHHNILYADPALIGAPPAPQPGSDLIDWATAIPARLAALRRAWAEAPAGVRDAVAVFRRDGGAELERHVRFDALHAHFFASGATGWQGWPTAFHDPGSEAVARFAAEHADAVAFYAFAQWLADAGLAAAQRAARDAGMAIGLIADLAIGMDPGGSHAWGRRDELLTGLSLGAPPDLFYAAGQDWGITGFDPRALARTGCRPFAETLRAGLAHAGGIRIDHVLGLRRLWVVPAGASAADGAYLSMPLEPLLETVAVESARAGAIVIGEDLGTVPYGLRETLAERRLMGMRVLQFERAADGGFIAPSLYTAGAAAMTGTHDLPTIAGWWQGTDLTWAERLGRSAASPAEREGDRRRLWDAEVAAGAAAGAAPADAAPAVDAALAFVAATPSALALAPLEDLAGLTEQPNLPGTTVEHPNWRRRMPLPTADLLAEAAVARRVAQLAVARPHTNEP